MLWINLHGEKTLARPMKALGLMSGTSMDGIDAAIIETDGETIERFGPALTSAYNDQQRNLLMQAVDVARHLKDRRERPGVLAQAEEFITRAHSNIVNEMLENEGLSPGDIEVIGFHGQTVFHRPEDALTVQIGDGVQLAALTGIDVVSDFRAADMVTGGQGAPLAPVYHRAMQHYSGFDGTGVCVNIGGISNITWISQNGDMIAFDTGPGNVLLDAWCQRHLKQPYDMDGVLSCLGNVNAPVLQVLLNNPYFRKPPPKSLDKTSFGLDALASLSVVDGAATLAAFTAETIARSRHHMPQAPQKWIICGGGRLNAGIMRELHTRIGTNVISAEEAGFDGDSIEAQAFGYLAVRTLHGLPLTFPGTTGVAEPTQGGVVNRA